MVFSVYKERFYLKVMSVCRPTFLTYPNYPRYVHNYFEHTHHGNY